MMAQSLEAVPEVLTSKCWVEIKGTRAYADPNRITPHPLFHVRDPTTARIDELATNIQTVGRVINAVQCRPLKGDPEKLELLAGWRRYHAVKKLDWHEIPIDLVDVDDETAIIMILSENLSRKDLSPIEEAKQFQVARNTGMTEAAIANALKPAKSAAYISNRLRLLKLEESIQTKIHEGKISPGHAEHGLLKLVGKPELQKEATEEIIRQDLTVPEVEDHVRRILQDEEERLEIQKRLETAKVKKCPNCGGDPVRLSGNTWISDLAKRPFFQCDNYHPWDPTKTEAEAKLAKQLGQDHPQDRVNRVIRWKNDWKTLWTKMQADMIRQAIGQPIRITLEGKFNRAFLKQLEETGAIDHILIKKNQHTLEKHERGFSYSTGWSYSSGEDSLGFQVDARNYDSGEKSAVHVGSWETDQKLIDRRKRKVTKLLRQLGA